MTLFSGRSTRKIALVSPAGLPNREKVDNAVQLLEASGFQVKQGRHILIAGGETYYAASASERLADFNHAINDPETDLILCTRGGYGSGYLLPGIDWDTLRRRNLPVLGYSDITAVHLAMLKQKAGIPCACTMAAALPEAMKDPFTKNSIQHLFQILSGKPGPAEQIIPLVPESGNSRPASGPLIPANLAILTSLMGTPWLPGFSGTIPLIEEVGELPRRIDRSLRQILLAGLFRNCAAVIFGTFTDCGEPDELHRVIQRFAQELPCPVFSGVPFGHSLPTAASLCGSPASVDMQFQLHTV